jgi:diguanylate cyclase (GGDEF)-like protein
MGDGVVGWRAARRIVAVRELIRSGPALVLLGILVLTGIGATAGFAIWHSYHEALKEHRGDIDSMGVIVAEQTSRYVQVIDLMLGVVQTRIGELNITTASDFQHQLESEAVHYYLSERAKDAFQTSTIALIDTDGLIVNWSRSGPRPDLNAFDRDYFTYFKNHNDPGLFVGTPSKGRATGQLSLFFARRISGPDGSFLGLVLAAVDVKYLADFYKKAGDQLDQSVTLLRRDGTMLVHYPDLEMAIGTRLPPKSPWYARVAQGGGSYVSPGVLTGKSSLVSVHPLRDYPLVVDVLIEEAAVFAAWRDETVFIASFALTAALIFVGLFWMLAHQFHRQAMQNATLDAVLNNITQGVCFFDGEKRLQMWNRRYAEIYNLPAVAARVGRSLEEIMAYRAVAGSTPEISVSDYLIWRDHLATMEQPSSAVIALKDGRFVDIHYQPMANGGWVATHEDVTARQQAEASVAFMARHDSLTKLGNRMLFRERMEEALASTGRGVQFALIWLDLDNFKQVNDTLGHPVGDGLLVAIAGRLQGCVREGDTVARIGGDEFAIVQLAARQPHDAETLVGRIIAAFRDPYDVAGHQVTVAASIGVTVAPGDGVSHDTLMRNADIALYLAKTEGRGAVRFFEPEMDARIHSRRMLERDLQGAISRNEFELYYQPLVSLITDGLIGFEALLRWQHPVRGLVSPLDFIPVTEETGMITAIGAWALQRACLEAANWPAHITVAVNLSPVQFRSGNLVEMVQSALDTSGLRPDRLELEITESVLLRDTAATLTTLHQLRAMGIGVALDDFGTGYSSLSYLHRFPFSKIKIDQTFVRDLMTSKESMSIIHAVIGLGESLGIRTIAEGVETQEQLDKLREIRCSQAQGYFFGRPSPATEVALLIERHERIRTPVANHVAADRD